MPVNLFTAENNKPVFFLHHNERSVIVFKCIVTAFIESYLDAEVRIPAYGLLRLPVKDVCVHRFIQSYFHSEGKRDLLHVFIK